MNFWVDSTIHSTQLLINVLHYFCVTEELYCHTITRHDLECPNWPNPMFLHLRNCLLKCLHAYAINEATYCLILIRMFYKGMGNWLEIMILNRPIANKPVICASRISIWVFVKTTSYCAAPVLLILCPMINLFWSQASFRINVSNQNWPQKKIKTNRFTRLSWGQCEFHKRNRDFSYHVFDIPIWYMRNLLTFASEHSMDYGMRCARLQRDTFLEYLCTN